MENYQPTQKDWDEISFLASNDEPDLSYPNPEDLGFIELKRGDIVKLYGEYPAAVVNDCTVKKGDKIKITNPDALNTREEEVYSDYFDVADIEFPSELMENTKNKSNKTHNKNTIMKTTINEKMINESITRVLTKYLKEGAFPMMSDGPEGVEEDGLNPSFIASSIMEFAVDDPEVEKITDEDLDTNSENYQRWMMSVERMVQNIINKHPELTNNDSVIAYVLGEPEGTGKNYMKLFKYAKWEENASLEDLIAHIRSKGRKDPEAKAQALYQKYHGQQDATPAGLAEMVAKNVIEMLKEGAFLG